MYNFDIFVIEVKGDNGVVLLDLKSNTYMVLNNDESKELHLLMDGIIDIPYTDMIKKIIKDKWIVRSKFRYCMEEPHSHDYNLYDGMISHFELNRVIIEMSTTCPLNCKFCHTKENSIKSSCFCKKWDYKPQDFDYREFIEQITYYNVREVYILGGDPFYDECDFDRMISFIKQLVTKKRNKNRHSG